MDRRVQKMKQSRNTETREEQTREYTYEEPNLLDIPDSVYDRFLSQGLVLRWIRISLKGDDDYKNVGRKTQQGYEFVDPKEVPEMLPTSIVVDKGRYENCVVRGDVALAKIAKGQADARNKYYQEKSDSMMDAVNQQLMSNISFLYSPYHMRMSQPHHPPQLSHLFQLLNNCLIQNLK